MLADHNLLSNAIDYVTQQQKAGAPELSLHMSRSASVLATRVDMDQAMDTASVNPPGNAPGIYDVFVPLMAQWKQSYNYTGSYYIDIGDGKNGNVTDWTVSKPYYNQLLALGGEIGSHTITHPEDTNTLRAAQYTSEFQGSKDQIEGQLSIKITGVAVPGAPETIATDRAILAAAPTYDYLTGRYTGIGSDYPGSIGRMSTNATDLQHLILNPNMKSDFSLVEALPAFGAG